jgi:hypothetical protein
MSGQAIFGIGVPFSFIVWGIAIDLARTSEQAPMIRIKIFYKTCSVPMLH